MAIPQIEEILSMKTLTLLQTECVDIIYYSQFTKAANLNERVLAIRGERAQIGQVALLKIALTLYRCQNLTTYVQLFEGESSTYNLSLKWRTLSKWNDHFFKLESIAKTGNFSTETILERDFKKFYTMYCFKETYALQMQDTTSL